MNLRLKEENQVFLSFEILMDDDSIIANELALMVSNIRREVCGVLGSFLSFLTKYKNKKTHNMISLMLDPRFKALCIVSSFVEQDQSVSYVEEYDKKLLYPMLVKYHEHSHPLIRLDRNYVNQNIFDQDCSLDIFEQNTSTSKPTRKLAKRELLIFKWYQLDVKNIKCPFQWWEKHEAMFLIVSFLFHQILGIVGSHIKIDGWNTC
jgi:hypothetical protein